LGKLLGVVFGLELSATDVDNFLESKIVKKLNYWCSTKMHVTGRGIIVNGVLLSMTYFFLAVWGGDEARSYEHQVPSLELPLGRSYE
jgi:hypothetical protein